MECKLNFLKFPIQVFISSAEIFVMKDCIQFLKTLFEILLDQDNLSF